MGSFKQSSCKDCIPTCLKMRYIAAYLLATMGGNASPSADDIKQILGSVGVDDEEQLKVVIDQLAGKDVNEVMATSAELLASVPSGGAAAGGAAAEAAPAEEAKEEEKKEESESESDDDMGFDLFG